jgi:hypothetical protein
VRRAYAERTRVPVDQTRREIESTLTKYGATGFIYGWQGTEAVIGFRMSDRHVKFVLPLPDPKAMAVERAGAEARRRWRALLLVIKAKLEAVADGITIFDDEFMAHIVMPDGSTVAENIRPRIEQAYKTGKMPPLLPYSPRNVQQ